MRHYVYYLTPKKKAVKMKLFFILRYWMKKRFIFFVFLLSLTGLMNAQNLNLRSYSDIREGFRGVAIAVFVENIEDVINEISYSEMDEFMLEYLDEMFPEQGRNVDRLTRNNQWLARQALNEWDLEKNDIFIVICAENRYADSAIVMMVLINEDGESYRWWARVLTGLL